MPDIIWKKIMEGDRKISYLEAVNMAFWSHNMNLNKLGYTPMT